MELKYALLNCVVRYKTAIEHMTEDKIITIEEYMTIVKRINDRIKELTK